VKQVDAEEDEELLFFERKLPGKIMFILEFPFKIAAYITIPPVEEDKLVSPLVVMYSITTPLAFVLLKDSKINFHFF
jgi:hypothetical protein